MDGCVPCVHPPLNSSLATNSTEDINVNFEIPWRGAYQNEVQSFNGCYGFAFPRRHYSDATVTPEFLWRQGYRDTFSTKNDRRENITFHTAENKDEESVIIASLRVCTRTRDLHGGFKLHDAIIEKGLLEKCSDLLITMYAKCGELAKARDLLDQHKSRDVITWTALLTGYVRKGNGQKALDCFERMQNEGITPNAVTYSSVLKACGALRALEKGEAIHGEILKQRLLEDDFVLATALLDMYFKCGALAKAKQMSDNFSVKDAGFWNALISGYSQHGQDEQALHCFENMKCKGIIPNQGTYVCALKACSNMGDLDKGLQIHEEVASRGLLQSDSVLASAIVNMYVKCGTFPKAHAVFKKLSPQDAPSWNALITGYVLDGKCEQALSCFEQMNCRAIPPDAVTYGCILRACAVIHARKKGEQIHAEIARQGLLHNNIQLGNILIDMYVKFGALSKAHDVLKELPTRNVVSWSTLIAGYAQCGKDRQALECFEFMQHEGVPPDAITFVSMLNVCSHLGHVEEAHSLFVSMDTAYGVKPNLECCFCMIDLFGRAGHIEKAIHLVQQIPLSDSYNIWLSILGACQKYGDVHIGRWVFEQAILADENNGLAYILMANIYAAAGMQEDAMIIEAMRMSRIWKSATHSWQSTAPSNNSHVFAFDDLLYLKLPSTHMQLNSSEEDVLIK